MADCPLDEAHDTERRGTRPGIGRRIGMLAAAALLVAGCANLSTSGREVSLPDPPPQTETAPAAQREHARILAAYGGAYENPRLQRVLRHTVDTLVASSDRPDLRYHVTVLNSPAINAFALPNGHLYVTRGLLSLANDTSELASVLSHEMAHVIAQHAATREDKARQAAIVNRVVTDVLNDPQLGALALARSKIALASFSRAQELEADAIGVRLAARAGYDPYGATRFLTAMGRNAALRPANPTGGDPHSIDFLSSHPSTPERIKSALAAARQYSAPGAGVRDRPTYLRAIDGLTFGEDPSEGVVRGRRYLHGRFGFGFTAPDGFSLDNTPQALLGVREGGDQALRLDVVRAPAGQALPAYLTSGWIERVDPQSVEELTIGGLPAATATASGEQWSFRLYVVHMGEYVYRFVFAAKNRNAASERAFRESIGTFRRISEAEAARLKPARLRSVMVQPGDTPESLARRMATDRPLERFLILNGLGRDQSLVPGDFVKLVVE
jgi:predicted Zn-dependent protease